MVTTPVEAGFDYGSLGRREIGHDIGTRAMAVPGFGGRLTSLRVQGFELLAAPRTEAGLRDEFWFDNAPLFPFRGKLTNGQWTYNGETHQAPLNFPPFSDKTDAMNGLVYNQPFTVKEGTPDHVILELKQQPTSGYPFPYDLRILYRATANGVNGITSVCNNHNEPIPISGGMHFYFNTGQDARIQAPTLYRHVAENGIATGQRLLDNRLMANYPVEGSKLDDCFELFSAASELVNSRIHLANGGTIKLSQNIREFPYLQVFNGRAGTLALEPVTHPPGFDQNHMVLQPGETWQGMFSISYQPPPAGIDSTVPKV